MWSVGRRRRAPRRGPDGTGRVALMADWQQSFAKRLGGLREEWNRAFTEVVDEEIVPAFRQMESFLTNNGFSISTPRSEGGVRSFKFALGEDVYTIVSFRLRGPLELEASDEVFAGGTKDANARRESVPIRSVDAGWAQRQFQAALDRFVAALEAASLEAVAEYA